MIKLFYDNVKYRLRGSKRVLENIKRVIRSEEKISGDLNFIITGDKELIVINRKFLKHNYFTDVIAFGEELNGRITGEIYISIDTVKRNAYNYKVSLRQEILRVMIHGTLHLCGYEDRNTEEKNKMKKQEDKWLIQF